MQDEPTHGYWLSWRLAVEYVERHRGCSWGKAAKAVDDACASDELVWRRPPVITEPSGPEDLVPAKGPNIWEVRFWEWLNPPKSIPPQQLRVIKHLTEMHPNGVPPECRKKNLLIELRKHSELRSLDHKTLTRAINTYNSGR